MPSSYKRVYSDWKPSSALEKTDVMGTMEAIAGMIQGNGSSDKYLYSLIFSISRRSSVRSGQVGIAEI